MARKKAQEDGVQETEQKHEDLKKFSTMVPKTIINGHQLTVGTVIELTEEEAANHRSRGIALDDVHADDNREVYSVREPYVVPEKGEDE